MTLATLVTDRGDQLSPSERKVAEILLHKPEQAAFCTLAQFAGLSGTSGTTVLRLASKLDLDGYGALQNLVREELAHRLRPARQKIREPGPSDTLAHTMALEIDNIHNTFVGIDRTAFKRAAKRIADCSGRVLVLPADCVAGIGARIADLLADLRDGVVLAEGNAVHLGKVLRQVGPDDVAIVVDQRRYDRWILRALKILSSGGAYIIAASDSQLSPLAAAADASFAMSSEGLGPFDSQVATLAFGQALVAAAAAHLASTAAERLDSVDANWTVLQALSDEY